MKGIITILTFALFGSNSTTNEQKATQDQTIEKDVIEKALKYLASKQQKDGSWPEGGPRVQSEKRYANYPISFASFAGLSFIAAGYTPKEGLYKDNINNASEFVIISLKEQFEKPKSAWLEMGAIFLAHVYQCKPSDELKNVLCKVRDHLIKRQQSDGGWTYHGRLCGQSFTTNGVIISLLTLKNAGIKVDEKILETASAFYDKSQEDYKYRDGVVKNDGHFKYEARPIPIDVGKSLHIDSARQHAGRTVAALWLLEILGRDNTETYKKAAAWSKKYLDDIDRSHHGSAYHLLFAGLSCYYGKNKEFWKKYKDLFYKGILEAQQKDGSITLKQREGTEYPLEFTDTWGEERWGPVYTTSLYTIILQLHKGHLLFDKLGSTNSQAK